MAIYDQSYVPWQGRQEPRSKRFWIIAKEGARVAFRNKWARRIIVIALMVTAGYIFFIYLFMTVGVEKQIGATIGNRLYKSYIRADLAGLLIMVITAMIGCQIISRDMKHNAITMYFSKAISSYDYILGKLLINILYLSTVIFIPLVALQIANIGFVRAETPFVEHLKDFLAIIGSSLIVAISASSIALGLSSITKLVYLPSIIWAGLFYGSHIISEIVYNSTGKEWSRLISYMNNYKHVSVSLFEDRPIATVFKSIGGGGSEEVTRYLEEKMVMNYGIFEPGLILFIATVLSLLLVVLRLRYVQFKE
jgi:ABC-type transport system involved in multi-copper enzyme maturation permease subunit